MRKDRALDDLLAGIADDADRADWEQQDDGTVVTLDETITDARDHHCEDQPEQ